MVAASSRYDLKAGYRDLPDAMPPGGAQAARMIAPRHIAAWVVGAAYVVVSSALGAGFLGSDNSDTAHTTGWITVGCAVVVAFGTLVHRRHPLFGAALLMTGASVLAAGAGLVVAFFTAWSGPGGATVAAWGIGAALLVASPALLTGLAVIRGRTQ